MLGEDGFPPAPLAPRLPGLRPSASRRPWGRLLVLGAALVVAVLGWQLFWFLTDDAYITFRYVANLLAGHGLVWNPPPFRPVEGYTSFLWALVLAAAWFLTGLPPPRTANLLALACGLLTVLVIWRAAGRLRLAPRLDRDRTLLTALVFLGICTNRTFLTWLSSGLETQLFNLCLTWWLLEAMGLLGRPGAASRLRLSTAAALAALTRPDGLLTVPATLWLLGLQARAERQAGGDRRRVLRTLAPLLAVAGHIVWRRATYGEWLPNTFYAKVPAPWPAMGWRYLASFVVENGIWVWLGLAAAAGGAALLRRASSWRLRRVRRLPPAAASARLAAWGRATAVAVVLAHVGYYTLVVGGDHFEYRVWSYMIPLLLLATPALLDVLGAGAAVAVIVMALFIGASWPLPWLHWWWTRDLLTRNATHFMQCQLAPDFPPLLEPIVAAWDGWQAEMIAHYVCVRHQEHKIFHEYRTGCLPRREQGAEIAWRGRPAITDESVGVLGWVLPHVAVIDELGLNDHVIAHTPLAAEGSNRLMAHEREPPAGYLECFLPNVELRGGHQVAEMPRPVALTDERIRACESRAWEPADRRARRRRIERLLRRACR
jgi:arabinofuranosyltransferase